MGKLDVIKEKVNTARTEVEEKIDRTGSPWSRFKSVVGVLVMVVYRLRKVLLSIPVVLWALKLAAYNREHLPEMVGINLQASGVFTDFISRDLAIMGPLAVTAGCLVLMFFSRRAMYPWAISVFSLILPLLVLVSNLYPA